MLWPLTVLFMLAMFVFHQQNTFIPIAVLRFGREYSQNQMNHQHHT